MGRLKLGDGGCGSAHHRPMSHRTIVRLAGILVTLVLAAACSGSTGTPSVAPLPSGTVAASSTHAPSATLAPTPTAAPTATPAVGPGAFSVTGYMGIARDGHTATLLNSGLVLITGGREGNGPTYASAELYNPISGTFSATGSMAHVRSAHTAI